MKVLILTARDTFNQPCKETNESHYSNDSIHVEEVLYRGMPKVRLITPIATYLLDHIRSGLYAGTCNDIHVSVSIYNNTCEVTY